MLIRRFTFVFRASAMLLRAADASHADLPLMTLLDCSPASAATPLACYAALAAAMSYFDVLRFAIARVSRCFMLLSALLSPPLPRATMLCHCHAILLMPLPRRHGTCRCFAADA